MARWFSVSDLPRSLQDQAVRQMNKLPKMTEAEPKERRLKQDHKPLLNELEAKFLSHLTAHNPELKIHSQAKRYKIANGQWYKCDFVATIDGQETAWEVKGPHAHRGGFENLKSAASQFPEVSFILVWLDEEKNWKFQNILS